MKVREKNNEGAKKRKKAKQTKGRIRENETHGTEIKRTKGNLTKAKN